MSVMRETKLIKTNKQLDNEFHIFSHLNGFCTVGTLAN